MAELTHCIILFWIQKFGICLVDIWILVWHLFSSWLLRISLLQSIYSQVSKVLHCFLLLHGMALKRYINSFKHFTFEKRKTFLQNKLTAHCLWTTGIAWYVSLIWWLKTCSVFLNKFFKWFFLIWMLSTYK